MKSNQNCLTGTLIREVPILEIIRYISAYACMTIASFVLRSMDILSLGVLRT